MMRASAGLPTTQGHQEWPGPATHQLCGQHRCHGFKALGSGRLVLCPQITGADPRRSWCCVWAPWCGAGSAAPGSEALAGAQEGVLPQNQLTGPRVCWNTWGRCQSSAAFPWIPAPRCAEFSVAANFVFPPDSLALPPFMPFLDSVCPFDLQIQNFLHSRNIFLLCVHEDSGALPSSGLCSAASCLPPSETRGLPPGRHLCSFSGVPGHREQCLAHGRC